MLLFCSEEHVDRWCQQWKQPRGEVISLDQQWKLAQAWYQDRMELDWKRKTIEEIDTLWAELDFTASFWHLPR